ncbi:MerR family transcriptional regulator [Nakamurella sp. GG22]
MSVGEVAGRLGVAPSTVRMWGSRYGLTASARSAGGHRRYTDEDFDRMRRMQESVVSGVNPSAAAAEVMSDTATGRVTPGNAPPDSAAPGETPPDDTAASPTASAGRRGGPGGSVLAVPGANREVRGLARAASRLDEGAVTTAVVAALQRQGTIVTWDELLRPVLVAAGDHWQRTGTGIEVEHLLTQAVTTAFTNYITTLPKPTQDSPVVVAGSPREDHVLALHAVRAALAERAVPVRFLGPRTPLPALAATARLTRAPAVLLWMSLPDSETAAGLATVRAAHRRLVLLIGGSGWAGLDTGPATLCRSLDEAVALLTAAWARRSGGSGSP